MPSTIEHPPTARPEAKNRNDGHVQKDLVERYLLAHNLSEGPGIQEWIKGKNYAEKYRNIIKANPDINRRLLTTEAEEYEAVLDEMETLLYEEDL